MVSLKTLITLLGLLEVAPEGRQDSFLLNALHWDSGQILVVVLEVLLHFVEFTGSSLRHIEHLIMDLLFHCLIIRHHKLLLCRVLVLLQQQ